MLRKLAAILAAAGLSLPPACALPLPEPAAPAQRPLGGWLPPDGIACAHASATAAVACPKGQPLAPTCVDAIAVAASACSPRRAP